MFNCYIVLTACPSRIKFTRCHYSLACELKLLQQRIT